MLEIGNICELKLSHKIEEHGLLIFDINSNITARLHKRNLSNNATLSQKMFDLFDVGLQITALVTGFNEEKNYFELSTKAFRNSLDDVLSYTKCKNLIEEQFQKRSSQDTMFLLENRRILDRLRGDLASTGLTFLYELLQNAIDHPNNNFNKELSIQFEIFGNYLFLKHNGALFTENNFKSLCGILYGEQQNETDSNRIGYKGIGFKSVFRHTNNVYIRSGNFSFCFNKDKVGAAKPWEVMPIFQNEIDKIDEIPQFDFFNSPVAFAFEFPSEEHKSNVIKYLTELALNPYLVIFLDKLKKLKITTPGKEYIFEKEIINDIHGRNIIRLIIDGSVYSDWMSFPNTFLIEDQKIINELTDENNKSIPEHFRQFRKPQIDLIFPLNKIDNPINIFSYLPLSATRYQLNYIINGDFIPNLDRSNIIDNLSYNLKLTDFAGIQVVRACESFAVNSEFKKLKQLFPSFEAGINLFKDKLQISFLERVKDYEIFPSYYDGELSSFDNTLVDNTELYLILPKNQYNYLTSTTGNPLNPASDLQSEYLFLCDKFENGKIFTKEDLVSCLKTESFQNWLKKPENCFSLITHFDSRKELQALLKSENVFLNAKNELVSSNSLFNAVPDEISFIDINVLNSELIGMIKGKELSFQLLDFEPVEFYKKHILGKEQAINSLLITEKNLIAFWNFVYRYWESLEKEPVVINSLKSIHILCKSGNNNTINHKPISSTYLSYEFNTASEIESVINTIGINDAVFISEKYIAENYKFENWRRIFKKSEAITDLQAVIGALIPNLSSIDEKKHCDIGKQIFKYWKDNKDMESQLSTNQITAVRNNLKIKCYDSSFFKANDCIIADYYTTNPIIDTILPEIKLNNQTSVDYDLRKSYILEWNNFFRLIGCQLLPEKQNVFNAKIEHLIKNQELYREKHFDILQTFSQLYKERKDNNYSFDKLSGLFLQTSNDEWLQSNQIHFSSVYKPELDLQKNDVLSNNFSFLNGDYFPDKISFNFLKNLGVHNNFKFELKVSLKFDELNNLVVKEKLFNGFGFKNKKDSLLRFYNLSQIQRYTNFENHIDCYPSLNILTLQKFNDIFFDEILNLKDEYFAPTKIINNRITYDSCDNCLISFIKENETIENAAGDFVKPTSLFSSKLTKYINEPSLLPKSDMFSNNIKLDKSVEKIIGIIQEINPNICIQLLSRNEVNRISFEEIKELNIVQILKDYVLSDEEKSKTFLLNKKLEWKPTNELFFSVDENFEVEPSQHLHADFIPIAKNFGIEELSENNFTLIVEPPTPICKEEVKTFFENYAIVIAFKIDEINYKVIESEIINKANQYEFYEVTEIIKAFPETNPIFKKAIDFYIDADNKIFYKDYWKNNKELIDFVLKHLLEDKVKRNWLNSVLNRWSKKEIKEDLKANSNGILPPEIFPDEPDGSNGIDWANLTDEEKAFIKKIINGVNELNEKFDVNTTAKIKTLMAIKDQYGNSEISDGGRFLKAGSDEIIVRSAQSGLLYLDLYHWGRLNEDNVRLAVYTNSCIKIYDSQEDLIQFTKTQNKFGILRFPDDYTLQDYKSIDNIEEKGKWHFVFIVNDKTETARSYNSIINLDDYNF